ncbi:MAG TPA: NAD-dependent epimerase/dehydratase family protein [Thermoleophilaceae bacterium]|nr:NAD-dependent epimerase/dehydratase family protein [Thermoleophilaceae bacterium]
MKVLVTGGAGFVGSHVVDSLVAAGHEPRIFDLIPSAHHDPQEVETYLGDVTDIEAVADAARGCHAIAHLAAVADVSEVAADPAYAERVNAGGTAKILEAARSAGVPRVAYASTIWVYDGCDAALADEDTPIKLPRHPYTAQKLAGEMYCSSYAEVFGVDYSVLRFGIPYGPRARAAAVIPAFFKSALAGRPLTIAGGGLQSRRFTYVGDLARGVVAALAPPARNRVYNLASEETVTILELANAVAGIVGDTDILHTQGRAGDFRGAEISSARAAAELGWTASTTIEQGLALYHEWLLAAAGDIDADPVG